RRIVKDRTIAHAIIDAYSQASIKERSPEVHLFIEMNPEAVDVNVHPTKAEVRFREQSVVHEVVRRAFMEALGQGGVPQLQLQPEVAARPTPNTVSAPSPAAPEPPQAPAIKPMIPLGQFRDTFIIAVDDEGVAI